jgi:hypothetical protein
MPALSTIISILLTIGVIGPQVLLPKPFCLMLLLKGASQPTATIAAEVEVSFNVSWILRHIVERQSGVTVSNFSLSLPCCLCYFLFILRRTAGSKAFFFLEWTLPCLVCCERECRLQRDIKEN